MNAPAAPHPQSPLLNHCPPTLPASAYRDPARFDLEMRAIFRREWIHVTRLDDIVPMSLRRVHVAGQNILLVRDGEGVVRAFLNSCRHRGAELCETDSRKLGSRLISCPYHQWSYGLDGRLARIPWATPTADFRKEDHGLIPVHVRVWNGFVFVSLAAEPPPFELAPDLGVSALDNWPMADLVTGHVFEKELACNWKVFWENYNECLHCPGIHPELCDMVPVYAHGVMSPSEEPGWTPDTPPPAGNLKPGARTWTLSGKTCGPEFPRLTDAERSAGHTFVTLYPTMFIVAHVDYVRAVTLTPLGPERTRLTATWLFGRETLEQPGFDLADVTGFATIVLEQDGAACEMNQRGLRNEGFSGGTLMPQEFDIRRFHRWVLERAPMAAGTAGGAHDTA